MQESINPSLKQPTHAGIKQSITETANTCRDQSIHHWNSQHMQELINPSMKQPTHAGNQAIHHWNSQHMQAISQFIMLIFAYYGRHFYDLVISKDVLVIFIRKVIIPIVQNGRSSYNSFISKAVFVNLLLFKQTLYTFYKDNNAMIKKCKKK